MTKRHVQLSASPTPNPNAVKFYQICIFRVGNDRISKNNDNLDKSPLAKKLLEIDGIDIVMVGFNLYLLQNPRSRMKFYLKRFEIPLPIISK